MKANFETVPEEVKPFVFTRAEYDALRSQPVWNRENDVSVGNVGVGLKSPKPVAIAGFNQEFLRLIDQKGLNFSQGLVPVTVDGKRMLMNTELTFFGKLFDNVEDIDDKTRAKYEAWLNERRN